MPVVKDTRVTIASGLGLLSLWILALWLGLELLDAPTSQNTARLVLAVIGLAGQTLSFARRSMPERRGG